MLTIAIVNEKGGTGKTTTAVNLTAALGELGKKVLLVDLDGQAASSRWLGVEDDCRFADALWRGEGLEPIRDILPNVSLAPGSGKLDSVAHDLRPTQGGQLRKLLGTMQGFDFALIDCPPSLGNRLIGNALLAATHAIVPVETSILAMDGLKILLTTLQDISDGFDHHVQLTGVVACRFDARTRLSRLILDELKRALPDRVFETVIRENVRLRECPGSGKSILEYAPDSHAAEDYRSLARECLTRLGQNERISPQQFQAVSSLRGQMESLLRKAEQTAQQSTPEPVAAAAEQSAEPQQAAEAACAERSQPPAPDLAESAEAELIQPPAPDLADSAGAELLQAPAPEPATIQAAQDATAPADEPAPAIEERFEVLSPYGQTPPVGPIELADESTPETVMEIFTGQPLTASAVQPQPQEQEQPAPPLNVELPEPAPQADEPAEAPSAAGVEQDFPALREVLQKMVREQPAKKPASEPAKKESPWQKMLRAVGVER